MNFPLISIIIPTYKRSVSLISRAVQSALAQTYSEIEIIIVDDNASTPLASYRAEVSLYISNLIKTNKNIILVQNQKNLGGSLSRNEGIKFSHGEFITFLDDDDEFLPFKVEHQINFMLKNNLNFSFTDLTIYNEKNEIIDKRIHNDIVSFEKRDLLKYHLTKQITSTETLMISKELLVEIGGFDDAKMGQEFYLVCKLIKSPSSVIGYFVSDDIKAYRTNIEAISTGKNKIVGERELYKYKKTYFKILTYKERNYIRTRHRAVMAIAYLRNKKIFSASWFLLIAFFTNPYISIKEALMLNKKKKKTKLVKK